MKRNFRFLMTTAMAAALALAAPAFAHDGHDHGDEAPAASSNGPQRQPDGSVFLPKPSQRQIGVRTQLIKQEPLARSHELAGKVIMDPTTGGKVQAMVMGRLVPGPDGLPQIGQSVRKGQVLAYIEPASGVLERSGQMAQVAELRAGQALAQKRLARLRELSETVPRKEIEAAESEVNSLTERARALSGGLAGRDVLKAPVSGVIASSPAVAGQVVDARELVFEVVDPTQLRIEALAYDPAMAQNLAGAALAVGGQKVPLSFVGAASSLRALGGRYAGGGLRARGDDGTWLPRAFRCADEEPCQPEHRLGQRPGRALRAACREHHSFGWCIHRCHFGPGGRRPRGCRGRVPDQSSSLRGTIPCSSGFSKIAYETGSWSSSGRWC